MKDLKISELKFSDIQEATNLVVSQMESASNWKGVSFDKKSISLVLCNCVFTDYNCAFVAKYNDEMVGIVSGYIKKPYYAYIAEIREYGVCVKPEYRNHKVGKLLMSKWIQWGLSIDNRANIYMAWMSGEDKDNFNKAMDSIGFEKVGTMYKLNKLAIGKKEEINGE